VPSRGPLAARPRRGGIATVLARCGRDHRALSDLLEFFVHCFWLHRRGQALSGTLTRAGSLSLTAACRREPNKGACEGVRNPHFLFDGFGVVAAGGGGLRPSTKTPVAPKTR
jgi:hypothetical protein